MMGHAHRKHTRLTQLKMELIRNGPCRKKDLVQLMGMDQSSLHRYLVEIEAEKIAHGMWIYAPGEDEIELARMIVARYG